MEEDIKYEHLQKISRLVVIRNCVSLICFTILAIVFKNFWIVFGTIIFSSYVSKED